MIQTQYQLLVGQWHVLKDAARRWRNEEDGMTTVEVVIIAAVLLAIATALATAFNGIYQNHKASITG